MAKAQALTNRERHEEPATPSGTLAFVALPLETWRWLSEEANQRGMTLTQALSEAITAWARKGSER